MQGIHEEEEETLLRILITRLLLSKLSLPYYT